MPFQHILPALQIVIAILLVWATAANLIRVNMPPGMTPEQQRRRIIIRASLWAALVALAMNAIAFFIALRLVAYTAPPHATPTPTGTPALAPALTPDTTPGPIICERINCLVAGGLP